MSECTCHKNYTLDTLIPQVGVITNIHEETPDVKTFCVTAPDGGKLFEHMPGQCAMVCAPGVSEGMFSITSSPTNKEYQEFSIKKCGELTSYLHSLQVGDEITVRGPYGNHFPVEDKLKGKNLLFIAGGIGLAPLRSVINDKVAAIANCYECYGLIYNKTILEGYCGMDGAVVSSVDEINNFDTLKKVADDINSRIDDINKELGTDLTEAFASAGLDDGSSWRFAGHLANMPLYYEFKDDGCDLTAGEESIKGTYLDNFKNVWDMYVSDSAADPKTLNSGALNAESEFGMGEAVLYQNGDWEFAPLTDEENGYVVTADDLSMMPIYFGVDDENEGLCVGTENYWAVNAKASQEDIDATLEFLNWVITSDEGRDAITNQMGLTAPYDTFTGDYETKNAFAQAANKLMTDGKTSVAWSFNATPNVDDWRADVVSALTAYTAGEGEWDAVKTAFVDGWANQWKIAHEGDAQ